MSIDPALYDRLRQFGTDLERWRTEADRLGSLVAGVSTTGQVDDEMLVGVERSAGLLYDEITAFNAILAEVAANSPEAASELAPIGEALRLLLLEVTELGTRMYSLRSAAIVEPNPAALPMPNSD